YTPRHRWYNHGGAKTGQYQDLFRDALQMERAWELCFERFRFFDLKRWGIHYERVKKFRRQNGDAIHKDINDPIVRYNNLIGNIWGGQESYANLLPHHSYLPIPQISMSVNPNLKDQNLGY
ncbi:MAG: RagB/SusD family nutrient uptake outer membrane protein, partial [Bacteroidales bacterium]